MEFIGPCRFSHFQRASFDPTTGTLQGQPVGKSNPTAWVQIAAVSLAQTKNTMLIFASLFTERCKAEHGIDIGKEIIYAHAGTRRLEAVTSSPETMEGNRPSFVILNETHHWREKNRGHDMNKVIKRNIRKHKRGLARTMAITNAYDPQMDSVAQRRRETWEDQEAGMSIRTGVMYDSLEASPEALLSLPRIKAPNGEDMETDLEYEERVTAYLTTVIDGVKGGSWWLDTAEIVAGVLDGETDVAEARRFYYNQIVTSEDAWLDSLVVDAMSDRLAIEARSDAPDDALRAGWLVKPRSKIVIFGDLSKSRDMTAIIGCDVDTGYVFTIGYWGAPPGRRSHKARWRAPRGEVLARFREAFDRFNVVACFVDPSHALADEDDEGLGYWDAVLDTLHRERKDRLQLWAQSTGERQHSIIWDMSSPSHQKTFVLAAETFVEEASTLNDIERPAPSFMTDGHPELVRHLQNAKIYEHPKGYGTSLWKGARRSERKIDLAVAAVGARMLRRMYLNRDPQDKNEPGRLLMPRRRTAY